MKYGWDFEEYQVCVGETDFHVGKDSHIWVPQPGWLGGPPPATNVPRRAQVLAQLVNRAKCHQHASVWWCRKGARRRREDSTWKLSPRARSWRLFISSHILNWLEASVWPFSPNCSEFRHLKLSIKLRFQRTRNNQAVLYTGTFNKHFHSWFWVHFHTTALYAVIINSPARGWVEMKIRGSLFPSGQVNLACVRNHYTQFPGAVCSLALASKIPLQNSFQSQRDNPMMKTSSH